MKTIKRVMKANKAVYGTIGKVAGKLPSPVAQGVSATAYGLSYLAGKAAEDDEEDSDVYEAEDPKKKKKKFKDPDSDGITDTNIESIDSADIQDFSDKIGDVVMKFKQKLGGKTEGLESIVDGFLDEDLFDIFKAPHERVVGKGSKPLKTPVSQTLRDKAKVDYQAKKDTVVHGGEEAKGMKQSNVRLNASHAELERHPVRTKLASLIHTAGKKIASSAKLAPDHTPTERPAYRNPKSWTGPSVGSQMKKRISSKLQQLGTGLAKVAEPHMRATSGEESPAIKHPKSKIYKQSKKMLSNMLSRYQFMKAGAQTEELEKVVDSFLNENLDLSYKPDHLYVIDEKKRRKIAACMGGA